MGEHPCCIGADSKCDTSHHPRKETNGHPCGCRKCRPAIARVVDVLSGRSIHALVVWADSLSGKELTEYARIVEAL